MDSAAVNVESIVTTASSNAASLSFEDFWSTHRDRIGRAIAMTIGDTQLAADAVDEAMARAYQRWPQVSAMANPTAWVYRVGLNWTHSLRQRLRRQPPGWLATPGSSLDAAVGEPSIDAALAALPTGQRAVVVCRLLLGLSEVQTADALRLRPGTVKSRLARALGQLAITLAHLDPESAPKEDRR